MTTDARHEKLRWEGVPLYAHDVRGAGGCSGCLVVLAAAGALVCSGARDYPWPVPLAAVVFGLVLVGFVIRARRNTRYRVTTAALYVENLRGTVRWLVPRDVELAIADRSGRSIHLGEIPFEHRDRTDEVVLRGTRSCRLEGLGPDAEAVLRALEDARTDATYPPDPLRPTRHTPAHVKELCAARAPLALPDFLGGMPREVPAAISRAVRGSVARHVGVPVDYVTPADTVRAFMARRDYVDFTSFVLEVAGLLDVDLEDGALDEETWLDRTVAELGVAITRGRRPPGARREP